MVFPAFFESGEVMLNRVEVGCVRGQEEQRGTGGCDELRRLWRFVKRGMIQYDERLGTEARAESRVQPGVEDHRIACAFKAQRFFEAPFHTGGNERGSWLSMSGDQTVHAVALRRVPIPSRRRSGNAACIDMNGLFAMAKEPFTQAQELFPLLRIAFLVAHPFFCGLMPVCEVRSRCNTGRPGNAAPAPLVSDRDGLPPDGAVVPTPVCGNGEGLDARSRRHRA